MVVGVFIPLADNQKDSKTENQEISHIVPVQIHTEYIQARKDEVQLGRAPEYKLTI